MYKQLEYQRRMILKNRCQTCGDATLQYVVKSTGKIKQHTRCTKCREQVHVSYIARRLKGLK